MKHIIPFALVLILIIISADLAAQCPMCKIAAESNLENGGTAGKGLNNGILYMLSLPYVLIGLLGFVWYKNRKKQEDNIDESNTVAI